MRKKFNFSLLALVLIMGLILLPSTSILAAGHGGAPSDFYAAETLAEFDGTDDQPAYVAFNGRVYDVSDTFSDGSHQGNEAGQDLTEELYDAGHGSDVLEDKEVVGYYLETVMTEEELEAYDGSENPPYVAVDNIIYDASNVFEDGSHRGNEAGQDLTDEFHGQHGERTLEAMPVVGVLAAYELTEEELAEYDGIDDNDAFVAVDGFIYDVSERFEDGSHRGHEAGNDLTDEIAGAGHLRSVLPDQSVVGVLVE